VTKIFEFHQQFNEDKGIFDSPAARFIKCFNKLLKESESVISLFLPPQVIVVSFTIDNVCFGIEQKNMWWMQPGYNLWKLFRMHGYLFSSRLL
jgi:hypothetical protein